MRDAFTLEKKDGADEEEGQKAYVASLATQKEASSYWARVNSSRAHLALEAICASLLHIDPWLIAPMIEKRGAEGIGMCMCVRMRVIAKGKISLSCVAMS